jgi:hypothetical protein
MSNMRVPPLPRRYLVGKTHSAHYLFKNFEQITYGILSLINCVDCGGGRRFLGDDRIDAT